MNLTFTKFNSTKILTIFLFLLLAGRFYQFAFLEPPFRAFLLNTSFMAPFIEGVLGIEWNDWVTNPVYESRVNLLLTILAWVLGIFTLSIPFYKIKRVNKLMPFILICASVILLITSFGYYWDKSIQIGQFWEYSLQFGLPLLFLLVIRSKEKIAFYLAKFFCSVTFIAHGLYAIGFYPVPGEFVHMSSRLLSITDEPAKSFLFVAGIIDFVFALAIWIPKIQKTALLYGVLWGFATASARFFAFYYPQYMAISLHQSVFEMLVRLPHGAVPLWLLIKSIDAKDLAKSQNFFSIIKTKNNKNEIPKSI
jgi:hypothetical protein